MGELCWCGLASLSEPGSASQYFPSHHIENKQFQRLVSGPKVTELSPVYSKLKFVTFGGNSECYLTGEYNFNNLQVGKGVLYNDYESAELGRHRLGQLIDLNIEREFQ